ncbi:hypothetical protein SAMN05192550_2811 [Flavobacterium glycines]|uniref:Uncharacterized protein n=1 Tax=Flavobacterium glycines TaxID=551990 RepID=A0A1G8WT01_9FLAO|nr:hypothetical protein SAMN05192550_2811 [Flavobacterium glycines]
MFRLLLKYSLKLLPLVLHEIADYIKEKQAEKKENQSITSKIQENENSK